MQGSGLSSANIWTSFDSTTTAIVREPTWSAKVAWTRVLSSSANIATVGVSLIDGIDVISGQNDTLTPPDQYYYFDETDHVIRMEYDRSIDEPLGGISFAVGTLLLNNTSKRFSPNHNATIGTAIEPKKPVNMHIGFEINGLSKTLPIIKGLTRSPKENRGNRTVEVEMFDYVSFLNDFPLEGTVYVGSRSDEIIGDILNQAGMSISQYVLDTGLNTINFAWFDKGDTAGSRIRKICEAEEAVFYQDEGGILRFENRQKNYFAPYNASVWRIDDEDIIAWEEDTSTQIINRVIITANVREVQVAELLWSYGFNDSFGTGETKTIWASFNDPITSLNALVAGTDYKFNTLADGTGTDVTANFTVTPTLYTTSAKIVITCNSGTGYVTLLKLTGTPASIVSQIYVEDFDADSINKYDEHQLKIENNFIDNADFAAYISRGLVTKYAKPHRRIKLKVQGIPQLQLRDRINVYDRDNLSYKEYRLMRIKGSLDSGGFIQELTLREVFGYETDSWAVVDTALVAGQDVVGV